METKVISIYLFFLTGRCLSLQSLQWGAHHRPPSLGLILNWALGKGAAPGQGWEGSRQGPWLPGVRGFVCLIPMFPVLRWCWWAAAPQSYSWWAGWSSDIHPVTFRACHWAGVWLLQPELALDVVLGLWSAVLGCVKVTELILAKPGSSDMEPLDLHCLLPWAWPKSQAFRDKKWIKFCLCSDQIPGLCWVHH